MPVLALSGGLDSTTLCAALVREHGKDAVAPVFFHYGSKHNAWEAQAAREAADHFGLELVDFDLSGIFSRLQSALLAHDQRGIPKEPYAEKSMGQTLVPGRNLVFASVLAALAESRGFGSVALATHAGDHHLYPDCRPDFNASLADTLRLSSGGSVELLTPFSAMDKAAIVRLGLELGVPYGLTRSCYENQAESCGRCGTCRERLAAFARNGVPDPVVYASGES